jgi:N-acylneuraminate cytidylyltransferase
MNLAVIPARGGSKGIGGKNLRLVGGVPLVARTIQQARLSEHVHTVVVSTDCPEIAGVAAAEGAEVRLRPPSISGEAATSEDALLHALDAYPDTSILAFLQCTSPFTTAGEVDACMQRVMRDNLDVCFTACRTHAGYWSEVGTGRLVCLSHDPLHARPGRQYGPWLWRETGGVYAMRADGFRRAGSRFFGRVGLFEVCEQSALEVDSPMDLQVARCVSECYQKSALREHEAERCKAAHGEPLTWPSDLPAK